MKFRYKIPLLFLLMVFTLVALIVCFFQFYISEMTIPLIIDRTKTMVKKDYDYMQQIEQTHHDPVNLKKLFTKIVATEQNRLELIYQSRNSGKTIHVGNITTNDRQIRQTFPIYTQSQVVGEVTMVRGLHLDEWGLPTLIKHTFIFK